MKKQHRTWYIVNVGTQNIRKLVKKLVNSELKLYLVHNIIPILSNF